MLKICVLASGSKGNAIYIGSKDTHLLIDAGLSCKEMEKRLNLLDVSLSDIDGILVSHEHSDHIRGIPVIAAKYNIPVFANRLTAGKIKEAMGPTKSKDLKMRIFLGGSSFLVNSLEVKPFSVFHDAMDPVGFIVSYNGKTVAIATDLGFPSTLVKEKLKNVDVLVIECNYDVDLLKQSKRPWSLKQRIMGRQGHLSNVVAANLLAELVHVDLKEIFLFHLSQDCNCSDLALKTVKEKIGAYQGNVRLTYQDRISDCILI